MKRVALIVAIAIAVAAIAIGQNMGRSSDHGFFQTQDLKWMDGPASLPKGAKVAMLEGNPTQEGPSDHPVERQQDGQQAERPAECRLGGHLHPDGDDEQHHSPEAQESDDDVEVLAGPDTLMPEPGIGLLALRCCSASHLTAPAVRPATILRWKTSTRMTSGMVTMVPAAMMAV